MSQQSQYRDGDHCCSPSYESPVAGRSYHFSLGSAQDYQSSPLDHTGYRSHRRAAPSPLQTSISANSHPTKSPPAANVLKIGDIRTRQAEPTQYTPYRGGEPRFPEEQLDDLLASEDYSDGSVDMQKIYVDRPRPDQNQVSPSSRNSPPGSAPSKLSAKPPPTIPMPMPPPVSEHRAAMQPGIPRTSSIDSAISSVSGGTHSYKGSQETQNGDSSEITLLIQTAGSPEALIQHLLKEKKSHTSQNAKLWRLVDKQRAMILGLNKDLERALKEKERYRVKMKESMAAAITVNPTKGPAAGNAADLSLRTPLSAESSNGDNNLAALVTAGLNGVQDGNEEHSPITPPADKQTKPQNGVPEVPPRNRPARQLPKEDIIVNSNTLSTPSFNVTEPSPRSETFLISPPPPRKPPPAPLDLGNQANASSRLRHADSVEDLDSDYGDSPDSEATPTLDERGRRKTREQDDEERMATMEMEARSLSEDSKLKSARRQTMPYPRGLGLSDAPLDLSGGLDNPPEAITRSFTSPSPLTQGLSASPKPPLSARSMGFFPGATSSPSTPRQTISFSPSTPRSSSARPKLDREGTALRPLQTSRLAAVQSEDESPRDVRSSSASGSFEPAEIYQGFVMEEFPDLLLPPNALPLIDVKVASSRLKPPRASMMNPSKTEEDPVFTLAIVSRSAEKELWRVEKDSMSLTQIDQELKKSPSFASVKSPEKSLLSGHAPAKVDARRAALDKYFDTIMNTPMDTGPALQFCRYLSTNTLEPHASDAIVLTDAKNSSPTNAGPGGPYKRGYLTKKGKNFGGWKTRFFVLDGPMLKYYESPSGVHLGAVKLQHSMVHKQKQSQQEGQSDDAVNQFRHAFMILERKRKDSSSSVKHVLCAESDLERDEWVEALVQYVESESEDDASGEKNDAARNESASSSSKKKGQGQGKAPNDAEDGLRAMPYEATVPGQMPRGVKSKNESENSSPVEKEAPSSEQEKDAAGPQSHSQSAVSISAPKNATLIPDGSAWGGKHSSLAPFEDKKTQKKRSFFGFGGGKARPPSESPEQMETTNLSQMSYEQHGPIRAVFGAPLAEAVNYNHPADTDAELPAVVFRCIEYLDSKNAASEEGIFRLSGSNLVIKALRERFNTEADVNLITDEQYYDIHAVASLLKLYLRELPSTILTRELHLDFIAVTEIHDLENKVLTLNTLVHKLPKPNHTLLRYLSNFLIKIVNSSDINKMTVRNVGIVFSPTLNIPAPVFALFLEQYEEIFESEPPNQQQAVEVPVTATQLASDDIRSPRKQQFQDLPTPSYSQSSFPRVSPPAFPMPPQSNKAAYDTGFTPLQQSHGNQSATTIAGPEYNAGAAKTIAGPSYEQLSSKGNGAPYARRFSNENNLNPNGQDLKQSRRESFMSGLGMVQKTNHEQSQSELAHESTFD